MKANAPEKIYLIRNISTPTSLNTTNDCHDKYLHEWYKGREKDADVEYTRTDAFIEKVTRFLENKLSNRVEIQVWGTLIPSLMSKKEFIEEFTNYMKGE